MRERFIQNKLPMKIVGYALFLLLVYCLQTSRGTSVTLFSYRVDLLPLVLAAVALWDGPEAGLIIGLLTGILYDISTPMAEGLLPLLYMLYGVFAGVLSQRYLRKVFPACLLLSVLAILLGNVVRVLYLMWLKDAVFGALGVTLLAELMFSLLFTPAAYYPIRFLSTSIGER